MSSLLPGGSVPDFYFFGFIPFDKMAHFFEYGVFAFVLIVGFYKQYSGECYRFNIYSVSVGLAIGISVLMEVIQLGIPGRSFEFSDILANAMGALSGRLVFFLIYSWKLN